MRVRSRLTQCKAVSFGSIGLRKAIGDDIGFNMSAIARDAFGNALGSSIGQGINASLFTSQMTDDRDQRIDSAMSSSGMI